MIGYEIHGMSVQGYSFTGIVIDKIIIQHEGKPVDAYLIRDNGNSACVILPQDIQTISQGRE